ncbi:hypothetical protein HC891_13705 [Candidatus Gracilibacteria bacterium]|nr:hypothetical protein [Candidatus Gracilibacteria bacterium]
MPTYYNSSEALFGAPAVDDTLVTALDTALLAIAQRYPDAVIYAPLAIGEHVDHQLVYAAAVRLSKAGTPVAFYEDIPYVLAAGALERRFGQVDGSMLMSSLVAIDGYVARKLSAIEAYTSQIGMLFGGTTQMHQRIKRYADTVRPEGSSFGERLWLYRGRSILPPRHPPWLGSNRIFSVGIRSLLPSPRPSVTA